MELFSLLGSVALQPERCACWAAAPLEFHIIACSRPPSYHPSLVRLLSPLSLDP